MLAHAKLSQQFNWKGGEASLCRPEAFAGALALVALLDSMSRVIAFEFPQGHEPDS